MYVVDKLTKTMDTIQEFARYERALLNGEKLNHNFIHNDIT
jgi:hypothetical protein